MAIDKANEIPDWSAKVRKVDSNLHAAFARQQRDAARKQPFWKRVRPSREASASTSPDRQPVPGPGY